MKKYAIEKRFQYRTVRSNAISYTLECIFDECEWLMKASNINKSGMFRIRAFNVDHTCPLKDKVYSQKHAISMLIGGIVKPNLLDHKRKYTPSDIQSDVKIYLGIDNILVENEAMSTRIGCIQIYDSLSGGALHDSKVGNEIKKYAQLILMYLSKSDFYVKKDIDISSHPKYKSHSEFDSFEMIYVKDITQQTEGSLPYE
ncbi:hypothetical protein KY289_008704 [Solanum tuberosum]|nr:hypothetical protein KY289_008704 [Solanum tuberosum]